MKRCSKCQSAGPFYKDKQKTDGLTSCCRVCILKASNEYKLNNLEAHRERGRAWFHKGDNKIKRRPSNLFHVKAYQKRHPEKTRARWNLQDAVKRGDITRKPCEVCGDIKSHGHHEDYSKPLKVVWLCAIHHAERHRKVGVLSK